MCLYRKTDFQGICLHFLTAVVLLGRLAATSPPGEQCALGVCSSPCWAGSQPRLLRLWAFRAPQPPRRSRLQSSRAVLTACSESLCICTRWSYLSGSFGSAAVQKVSTHVSKSTQMLFLQQLGVRNVSRAAFPASLFPVLLLPTAPMYQRWLQVKVAVSW